MGSIAYQILHAYSIYVCGVESIVFKHNYSYTNSIYSHKRMHALKTRSAQLTHWSQVHMWLCMRTY